ncbi:RagB/SusD family nutrient uptake outer membrane protein [Capnocytophaga canimorsus]|nr:RagB/SusD family nutrient uptake outer membrane protein [Capnocytophaga canimorsus]WGU69524.1 RagB/SusD family nutrient uptake outer membrane protein [Capnocytophaga canimorsus]
MFAKAYSSSANTDLSVPIVTIADATQSGLDRASVLQVYEFIISDLEKAMENLPAKSKTHVRPNIGSVYSLLSRVYLYKGDYEKSLEYANKAIEINSVVLGDYVNSDPKTIDKIYRKEQYSVRYFGNTKAYQGGIIYCTEKHFGYETRYSLLPVFYILCKLWNRIQNNKNRTQCGSFCG